MGCTACTEPQYLYKGALYLNALMTIHCNEADSTWSWHSRVTAMWLAKWTQLHLRGVPLAGLLITVAYIYICHFTHNSAAETISLNSMILLLTVWTGVSLFQSLLLTDRCWRLVHGICSISHPWGAGTRMVNLPTFSSSDMYTHKFGMCEWR